MVPLAFTAARYFASLPYGGVLTWLARFGTRIVARRLDVPEIVVHAICLYIAAYVREVERNASLVCPIRVFNELRRDRSGQSLGTSPRGQRLKLGNTAAR